MNNDVKLANLANEFAATMEHAEEVLNEYVETAIKQSILEAFNELTEEEQLVLILGLLTGSKETQSAIIESMMNAVVNGVANGLGEEEEDDEEEIIDELELLEKLAYILGQ